MNALEVLTMVGGFLASHPDLIMAVKSAIESGTDKDTLMRLIKDSMVAASDAEMKRELG